MTPHPIPDAQALVEAVLDQIRIYSRYHSPLHWRCVAAIGLELLEDVPETDRVILFLFALFHDSRRRCDDYDPGHGERGAALARELHGDLHHITPAQMDLLEFACIEHDNGQISDDPTVGVCWDSDRLNLWRVDVRPRARLLSTHAAKERIGWARGVRGRFLKWEDLARDYGLRWPGLCGDRGQGS